MTLLRRTLDVRVLRPSAAVLAGSVVAILANAVAGIISARALSVSDKGLLTMIITIGPIVWVVASMGSNVALRVSLPDPDSGVGLRDFGAVNRRLALVHAGLTALLLGAALWWIPELHLGALALLVVLALSVAVFFSSQALEALHAVSRHGTATRVDALGSVITLACAGLTAWWPTAVGLELFLGCYLVGYLARILVAERFLRPLRQQRRSTRSGRRRLLLLGRGYLGYNVGQIVAFRSDRYLLGALANPTQLGLYAVATTPAETLRLPVTALGQVMMQRSAAGLVSVRVLGRICLLAALVTVPPAALLIGLADEIVVWLFGSRYAASAPVLQVMVLSEVVVCFFLLLSRIAAGAGLVRSTGVAAVVGAVIGVATLCWWAPTYGAIGAAWASAVAYTAMLAVCAPPLLVHLSRSPRTLGGPARVASEQEQHDRV